MSSGGGGETGKTGPWAGQEDSLKNLYRRAEEVTRDTSLSPYGSLSMPQKAGAAQQMWGMDPMKLGATYGLSAGQTDAMLRTGVAPLNNYQNAANQMLTNAANSPVSNLYGQSEAALSRQLSNPFGSAGDTAQQYMTDAATGKYLSPDSNPYLEGMYNAAARRATSAFNTSTLPSLTAQFSASGRYGSGQQEAVASRAADSLQQNLTDTAANMYGQAYEAERSRQQQAAAGLADYGNQQSTAIARAAALTPQVAEAGNSAMASRAAMMNQVGSQYQNLQNQLYGNLANAYQGKQQAPYTQLAAYNSAVTGNPTLMQQGGGGGGGGGGAAQGALGGAAAGASMGAMTGNPYGVAAGAVLGGIYGGFF